MSISTPPRTPPTFSRKILLQYNAMDRRDFIRQMGGLVGGLAFGSLSWPSESLAAAPYKKYENYEKYEKLRLALLADAHLKNGAGHRPEARALARAVAEINALPQGPDLVLFAGDLAHQGRPDALDLGREILSDLAAPLWAVRGEGDLGRGGPAPWVRRFGSPRFSRAYQGVHVLGLDTVLVRTSHGAVFEIGHDQRQWLAQELARLDSATLLVIVSHAPLGRLFLPWQQWTQDATAIAALLARFRQVLCLHGHGHGAGISNAGVRDQGPGVGNDCNNFGTWHFTENRKQKTENSLHYAGARGQGSGVGKIVVSGQWPVASEGEDACMGFLAENRKSKTENSLHLSLPATAWPRPLAVQGTPAIPRPGARPHGCGWALVNLSASEVNFFPHLWQT